MCEVDFDLTPLSDGHVLDTAYNMHPDLFMADFHTIVYFNPLLIRNHKNNEQTSKPE